MEFRRPAFFEPAPRRWQGNRIPYKPSEIDRPIIPEKREYINNVPLVLPGGGKTRMKKYRSGKKRKTRRKRNKRSRKSFK